MLMCMQIHLDFILYIIMYYIFGFMLYKCKDFVLIYNDIEKIVTFRFSCP